MCVRACSKLFNEAQVHMSDILTSYVHACNRDVCNMYMYMSVIIITSVFVNLMCVQVRHTYYGCEAKQRAKLGATSCILMR